MTDIELERMAGRVEALHSLILGLANEVLSADEFRDVALSSLRRLRDALIASPISEARLEAIDDTMKWVVRMTSRDH